MTRGEKPPSWPEVFLSDAMLRLCAVYTLAFAVMPPEGIGLEWCLCKRLTGAPCPGCGMTRCGACMTRGLLSHALQYHPLGAVVIPLCVLMGLLALAPRRWRGRVRTALVPWSRLLSWLWWTGVGVFVFFGLVRWGLVYFGLEQFPPTWP